MSKFLSRIHGERETILRKLSVKLSVNWLIFENLFFSIIDREYQCCTTVTILGTCRKIAQKGLLA